MGNEACSIAGCDRPSVARTWCRAHWKHWRRWGDPAHFQTEKPRIAPEVRFWAKVDRQGSVDCWEWTAARDPLGYGFFRMETTKPMWRAHRAAWTLTNGPIPEGLLVCHKCDNPPCCNPGHLFLGRDADNTADRVAKGRSSRMITHYGETSPLATLTAAQVADIRYCYAAGGIRQRELAEEYDVAQTTISKIVRRVRWKSA